jgi:uncharacterized protein YndB with AHSA1/START domain
MMIFLSNTYEGEASAVIESEKANVYSRALKLEEWNLAAIYGGLDLDDIPRGGRIEVPGVNTDSLIGGLKREALSLRVHCEIIQVQPPDLLRYRMAGGPLDGMETEVTLIRIGDGRTDVHLREHYTFSGFFGSAKALMTRWATRKLHKSSLENLKKLCESSSAGTPTKE